MAEAQEQRKRNYLKEYKLIRPLYEELSRTVESILENSLRQNDFKYQLLTYRVKSRKSLKGKLNTHQHEELVNISKLKPITDIDDLSGCRVIFYLDKDVNRFIQFIYEKFNVVKHNLKYTDNNYNALHLVVKLKRSSFPSLRKYKKFKRLKCEIQLTTVLYHAWSELAHDVVYKPDKNLSEFDKKAFDSINQRFSNTMKQLKSIQSDFDFISKQWEDVRQGRQIFSEEYLKEIVKADSINELWHRLKLLLEYIDKFDNKTPKELRIIEIINTSLEKSQRLKKEPVKTSLGDLPGFDYLDIVEVCLSILERLRFIYPKEVFEMLSFLSINDNESVSKKTQDVITKIAKYNFSPAEKKLYFNFQLFILDEIKKWDNDALLLHKELVQKATQEFLSPNYYGSSWTDYNKVTMHNGALPVHSTLIQIRKESLGVLKRLYAISRTVTDKENILNTLEYASYLPNQEVVTKEFEAMVLIDVKSLISFYSSIIKGCDKRITKVIEEQLFSFSGKPQDDVRDLEKLKLLISRDDEYAMYKVFVGYDDRYSEKMDWRKSQEERKHKIGEFVDRITQKNFSQWQKSILMVCKDFLQIGDYDRFKYFGIFLNELGRRKPRFSERLILESEKELEPFLTDLLVGIWEGHRKAKVKAILKKWITDGKYLSVGTFVFERVKEVDELLLQSIYEKAKVKKDTKALTSTISCVVSNFEEKKVGKDLFIACIKELEKNESFSWVDCVWFRKNSILKCLTRSDWHVVLKNLIRPQDIDYDLEEILIPLAKNYPEDLLKFFYDRITIKQKKKPGENYDAIPFRFNKLMEPLSQNASSTIREALKWFRNEKSLAYWEAAHFIQTVFPSFHEDLEEHLITLIKSRSQKNINVVLHILRAYEGQIFLHNVCKELIKQFPRSRKYWLEIFIILSKMGVVSNEYGFVKGYERKRQEIAKWKNTKNSTLRNFVKEYQKYLLKKIIQEKKRADEDIVLSKKEFES